MVSSTRQGTGITRARCRGRAGVLVLAMQNWTDNQSVVHCTYNTSNQYQKGLDEDAVTFYDVRDPEHPKYWGKMTAAQLTLPYTDHDNGTDGNGYGYYARELSAVSLFRSATADEWTLSVYGNGYSRTWKIGFLSPNIEDWTKVSDVYVGAGQHGDEFNSYQWDSARKVTVPANGTERNMTYNAGNEAAGGGEHDGFHFGGSGSLDRYITGTLPGAGRDWDAETITVARQGVTVIYSMESGGDPDGSRGNNHAFLYQVRWNQAPGFSPSQVRGGRPGTHVKTRPSAIN